MKTFFKKLNSIDVLNTVRTFCEWTFSSYMSSIGLRSTNTPLHSPGFVATLLYKGQLYPVNVLQSASKGHIIGLRTNSGLLGRRKTFDKSPCYFNPPRSPKFFLWRTFNVITSSFLLVQFIPRKIPPSISVRFHV